MHSIYRCADDQTRSGAVVQMCVFDQASVPTVRHADFVVGDVILIWTDAHLQMRVVTHVVAGGEGDGRFVGSPLELQQAEEAGKDMLAVIFLRIKGVAIQWLSTWFGRSAGIGGADPKLKMYAGPWLC